MAVATRRELLEAGVHFGHQTKRWNPKMHPYLFGQRSGIYIIDLEKTLDGLQQAYEFVRDRAARGGVVLFVGTKKQAQEIVAEQATRVNMPYVNTRWLGGMLTNFQTIYGRLTRLKELRDMDRSGAFEFLPKKEVLRLRHEKEKLERNLAGIQDLERLPDAIFVIDTKKEHIAVTEARKLGLPVVAIVDTNCDPDEVDYVIPGNDDAIRSCAVVTRVIANAVQEGQYLAYQRMQTRATAQPEFEQEPGPVVPEVVQEEPASKVTLSAEEAAWMGASLEEDAEAAASRSWAAPADASDLEARTIPDLAGPAGEPESVEAAVDRVPESPDQPREDQAAEEGQPDAGPTAPETPEPRREEESVETERP
ncbi:MAG TPA: 30S ribosomal protein S2, partial [Actinomycetota bacterium]